MEDEQEQQDTQSAKELSDHEQKMKKLLAEAGFKEVEKTGAILMFLSREQREAMEKATKKDKRE